MRGGEEMNATISRTVSLGKPVLVPCLIPVKHKATPNCINDPFMINGECYKVTAMSFGSPHGAVFVDDIDAVVVHETGSALGTNSLFPEGANIVFIKVLDKESIKARLWHLEKGESDFTAEAVCVAGAAAMMLHRILNDRVNVHMGDNVFEVEWDRRKNEVSLTGPADLLEI
jgi:diaminopimelate epimerase